LAKTLNKKGIKVVHGDLRDIDISMIPTVDLIVIGSPVFYYDTPDIVKGFIQSLPDISGIPVAAYVTFGGPEGNQHNAGCSILEGLVKKKGRTSESKRTLTLREFSTYFGPEWWTKLTVDNHHIIEQNCVGCGACVEKCPTDSIDIDSFSVNTDTCVLCFGCINNCQYQAVNMESNNEKLIGFHVYMEKNNLKFVLPDEIKT